MVLDLSQKVWQIDNRFQRLRNRVRLRRLESFWNFFRPLEILKSNPSFELGKCDGKFGRNKYILKFINCFTWYNYIFVNIEWMWFTIYWLFSSDCYFLLFEFEFVHIYRSWKWYTFPTDNYWRAATITVSKILNVKRQWHTCMKR